MVAVTLPKTIQESQNVITIREALTFGKYKGLTGAELLKSAEGKDYLHWVFTKTDIKMEAAIVDVLHVHGVVDKYSSRGNSLGGEVKTPLKQWGCIGDAIKHEARVRNRQELNGAYIEAITVRTNPELRVMSHKCAGQDVRNYSELVKKRPYLECEYDYPNDMMSQVKATAMNLQNANPRLSNKNMALAIRAVLFWGLRIESLKGLSNEDCYIVIQHKMRHAARDMQNLTQAIKDMSGGEAKREGLERRLAGILGREDRVVKKLIN